MPSETPRQQRFFGAELGRARAGKKTETNLPEAKLREFARGKMKHNDHGRMKKPRGHRE